MLDISQPSDNHIGQSSVITYSKENTLSFTYSLLNNVPLYYPIPSTYYNTCPTEYHFLIFFNAFDLIVNESRSLKQV